MGYSKDHNIQVDCPKDNVERKSTRDRSTEVSIEDLKPVGRNNRRADFVRPAQTTRRPFRAGAGL
jgi:hypothetical protein